MYSRTKLGIVVIVVLILLVAISRLIHPSFSKSGPLISPNFFDSFNLTKTFSFEFESSPLQKLVQSNLEGKKGEFGIYIENLSKDEKYGYHETEIFPAASLYKLVVMAAILKEVEEGNLELDTVISGSKSRLTSILGSVDWGYEERGDNISYTVEEALTRIGEISDNFAAIMLTDKLSTIKVGIKDEGLLIKMPKELEMNQTNLNPPGDELITTSPSDIATFFRRLYNGQVVSQEASEKIIGYLDGSKLNNRIPAGVPEGVRVIHKTGELARVRHDAGIVYLEGNPYLIVLMSKDLQGEDDAIETMVNISKAVFKYFEEKSLKEKSEVK